MRVLYVYPHPDDESFGPAHVMSNQRRQGHDVHLLTLTRGGATRQRHRLGLTVEEMGRVRYHEMLDVASTLDLSGMNVLDLPDSGLKEMDPRDIEDVVRREVEGLTPDVVVTYPVHGISGFHDHLVTHAVVKRVYTELSAVMPRLRRLAFITLDEDTAAKGTLFRLSGSSPAEIDCIVRVGDTDIERANRALDCYATFRETIDASGIRDFITHTSPFELYREDHDPPLGDLFDGLDDIA